MARKKSIRFEEPFEGALFGIVTQLKDYRLCWYINRALSFELVRMNDVEIIHKKKNRTAVFSLFRFENDLDKFLVHLVSNKYQGEYFFPEVKQADFLLVVDGEIGEVKKDDLLSSLKKIPTIQLVVPIESTRLKSKENLLFE